MFTLELVQAGSAAGSAQPGGGFAHISFIQLWIRSLSFALIFLFPRRKKWGEINKKRAEVAEAGSGNFEDEKPPRWCRLIYITKPSRGARCLFFSSFFNPQTELCIFSSCLQTSVILKMEIKKKRMITITCNWLSSNLLLFCGSDHFWGSMTLNLETNKTTSLKKKIHFIHSETQISERGSLTSFVLARCHLYSPTQMSMTFSCTSSIQMEATHRESLVVSLPPLWDM